MDGHSDPDLPLLTESVYTDDVRGFVQRQLGIGDFILPAVMRGLFKEVVFLTRAVDLGKKKSIPERQNIIMDLWKGREGDMVSKIQKNRQKNLDNY